ncbi:MAG: hypothetical protein ABII12_08135 [Planctomycetota bacterium]
MSISVGVIISGIAASLVWNASKQMAEVSARGELYDMGSAALETMFRYLREIPQDECPVNPTPCLLGNAQISTATATELRFGNTGFRFNTGANAVEMTADNGTNWYALATDVGGFAFAYYDRSANSLTSFPLSQNDREDVRRISVDLQMTRAGQTAQLRSAIFLRSFMDEVNSDP